MLGPNQDYALSRPPGFHLMPLLPKYKRHGENNGDAESFRAVRTSTS